jgi:amidophosphoribosyltransferase
MEKLRHNCGLCVTHSLHDVYNFIKSLQHRGREAAGIAAISENRIDVLKWKGTVSRFDVGNLHDIFFRDYHTFLGHVRYATRGKKNEILNDAHPVTVGGVEYFRGDHLFVSNCEVVIVHNGQSPNKYFKNLKNQTISKIDSGRLLDYYLEHGEVGLLQDIPGAYTLAIADKRKKDVIVIRDRTGIRPGVLGEKDGKKVIASEGEALRENGATIEENLDLGCIYYLSPDGKVERKKIMKENPKKCFFEWNYLGHVFSVMDHVSLNSVRIKLGEKLAEEIRIEGVDYVTYTPRCPKPAAVAYARGIGKPLVNIFYKLRSDRSFMGSTVEERADSISENLYDIPNLDVDLREKVVVNIEDSVIRGNNSLRTRELLYEKIGVKEAHMLSYTPMVGIKGEDGKNRGCMFGVDMAPDDKFVARKDIFDLESNLIWSVNRTEEEISEKIGMPVRYLSLESMLEVFEELGIKREELCYYCIGGKHPFE